MLDWNFENDDGRAPQMHYAHRYVERWQIMRAENLGLLLWGGVGTGKSFLAGCIANALMEQEVPVRMTNFARIMNELKEQGETKPWGHPVSRPAEVEAEAVARYMRIAQLAGTPAYVLLR